MAVAYACVLLWLDGEQGLLARLGSMAGPLAVVVVVASITYACRYARWRWLLMMDGHRVRWWAGFAAYLSGFAFTATPGKAGELIRIHGFAAQGIPASRTIAVFVFERSLDLLVLLLLSVFVAGAYPAFALLAAGVAMLVGLLVAGACCTALNRPALAVIAVLPGSRLRAFAAIAFDGLKMTAGYWRPRPLAVGLGWGLVAWTATSASFGWLCAMAGITLSPAFALGVYPLAMLAGAASFIPGGMGTTEATIVLLLTGAGAPVAGAMALAVGIRLATLWYAVALGLVATASIAWAAPASTHSP